mmetsp:Transcript_1537/g.1589  ORF Transcript_1537/g.1589 Transcript_1537/m.1589 type:complete len:118 (-) Transcript_1537:352-705(-)
MTIQTPPFQKKRTTRITTAFHANLANALTTIETNNTTVAHSLFRKSTVGVKLNGNVDTAEAETAVRAKHRKLLASRLPVIQLPSTTQPSETLARDAKRASRKDDSSVSVPRNREISK